MIARQTLLHPWLIVAPVCGAVGGIALVVGALLYWSAAQVDTAASTKQVKILSAALERGLQRIAKDQEAATVWDDAIEHLNPADFEWLDANLGIWMNAYYGHDRTYIVSAQGMPLYAMADGRRETSESYESIRNQADPLVRELRAKLRAGAAPESDDMLSVGVADVAVIGGHPAIVSAKPIVSDTGEIVQVPGSEAIHISVRYLDGDFIGRLASNYFLDFARFSWTDDRRENETALPYKNRAGDSFGYLIWTPYLPGSSVRSSIQPALVAALALIGLIIALLAFAMRRGASALRRSEARARHLAAHDPLTDLPNRMLFNEQLDKRLREAFAMRTSLALLSVDLDRFKQVNDQLGHPAGDELLRQVAVRFNQTVRGSDLVARLGGDEFAIILSAVEERTIEEICDRLLAVINQPLGVLGSDVSIGVSIGVAVSPGDATTKEELIGRSDRALYAAKRNGRNRYVRFTPSLEQEPSRRVVDSL